MPISFRTERKPHRLPTVGILATIFVASASGPVGISIVGIIAALSASWALVSLYRAGFITRASWACLTVGSWSLLVASIFRFSAISEPYRTGIESVPLAAAVLGHTLVGLGLVLSLTQGGASRGERLDTLLDAFIAAAATLLVLWMSAYDREVAGSVFDDIDVLGALLMPPMSMAAVVITVETARRRTTGITPFAGFVIGAAIMFIVDLTASVTQLRAWSIDAFWLVLPAGAAAVVVLRATTNPGLKRLAEHEPVRTSPSSRRLMLAMSALCVPPIVLVVDGFENAEDRTAVVTVCLAMTAVSTTRVVRTLWLQARSEARLRHEATHDRLTDLSNRYGVMALLNELGAAGVEHSVLMLDLDRFKLVNDSSGHHVGDELLMLVAERLKGLCGPTEHIARLGSDEFVIVTTEVTDIVAATQFAGELRDAFQCEVEVGGMTVPLALSIGVTSCVAGATAEDLLREADTAIHEAKGYGGNVVVPFDASMSAAAIERSEIERDLHSALARNEFEVHYQPIVDLATGRVSGFEALLRWNHADRGMVPPLRFIPIAEETGLIVEIGAWVLDTALRELATWRSETATYSSLTMSVNVSARQLRDPDFLHMLNRTLIRHRVEPRDICLELTESLMVEQGPHMERVIGSIRDCGVRLAIDDFGTGYSSLAYVQRYPFTSVKIDRSFVELLDGSANDGQLVGAIVAMASAMGCTTIAEGIETLEQAQRLVELGCTTGQGFYYSRPLPAAGVPTALARLGTLQPPSIVSQRDRHLT